jgi:hypothetical protein
MEMKTRVIQGEPEEGGAAVVAAPPAVARAPGGRAGRVAGGAVLAALGVAALAGGGALVGVHATQRDGDGFYAADAAELTTPARALVSDDLDVDLAGVGWATGDGRLADLRLSASSIRDGPVFVGIGPRRDVEAYLRGVPQESADFGDAGVRGSRTAGALAPAPPASQAFWSRSKAGPGRQTIVWPIESGDWSAVVMNADGSAGVRVEARLGVRTDLVLWLGIVALAAGGALAAVGTALIVSGRRGPEERARDDP